MTRMDRRIEKLLGDLSRQKRILLLLDFDGTLCETASTPARARLSGPRRALLRVLRKRGFDVAVVSGRSAEDLRRRVGIRGFVYCGNFGLEMRGPGFRYLHPRAGRAQAALERAARRLAGYFRGFPGVLVEPKGWGVALHDRLVAPRRLGAFRRRLARLRREDHLGDLSWRRGARVWEILPDAPWGKGRAAVRLWRRLGKPYMLAVGNDRTDEGMFEAARGRGAALRVGLKGRSAASYRLRSVAEVYRFLGRVAQRAHLSQSC